MATTKLKKIAVLCSGGDAPGMNAAIRSVIRTAAYYNIESYGVMRGYTGLISGDIVKMGPRSVSNIIDKGGTIIKTARCPEFLEERYQKKAVNNLKKKDIDGLVVIGGNGSFKGAHILSSKWKVRTVGVPGTIDNDLQGTDFTVGADTAVNTALGAIDKIRDTATSLERIYIVEVMGRDSDFIPLRVALSGGAEDVLVHDTEHKIDQMCEDIKKGRRKGKISWIIVVAEGIAGGHEVGRLIREGTGFDTRVVVLGHIQRGGSPTAYDRMLASRLGAAAIEALIAGETDKMAGIKGDDTVLVPFTVAVKPGRKQEKLDREIYKIIRIMAT
ncbi:MAG: 6-phosphofructokinase [Candidatus Omnitrophica bacterium CG1_02_49_10]|nr:MAG: 6-phosphofructokinase [Candidatus Omnitrophica bacterium CG1_02_49_10]